MIDLLLLNWVSGAPENAARNAIIRSKYAQTVTWNVIIRYSQSVSYFNVFTLKKNAAVNIIRGNKKKVLDKFFCNECLFTSHESQILKLIHFSHDQKRKLALIPISTTSNLNLISIAHQVYLTCINDFDRNQLLSCSKRAKTKKRKFVIKSKINFGVKNKMRASEKCECWATSITH